MRFKSGLAGLALAGSALLWGSTALSQPVAVPIAAAPGPEAAADPDAGLEAREAAAPLQAALVQPAPEAAPAPPIPGTLNAQFAAIQANPALAAPEPEPPPPAAAPVAPVTAQPLPPVGVQLAAAPAAPPTPIEAVADAAAPSSQPMQTVLAPAPMASAPMAPPAEPTMQPVAYTAPAPVAAPTAPSGPSVALSHRVVESAEAFVAYMQRASSVKPQWADAPGVAHGLELGATYEQGQLEEGEIAYVALVALQDPRFVATLRGAASDPRERSSLARALAADPAVALQTPGARSAVMRAAAALGRLGYGLHLSGEAVKRSAYDMQHSAWSLTNVAEPQAALLRLKARSAVREPLGEDGGRTLIAALTAPPSAGDMSGEVHRVTPVVARGLTLAALAMLGEAGEDRGAALLPILAEATNAQCVKMARLNLYQCLSVAGPQYEDVFCLGEHAMMETAKCVEDASGWTPTPGGALMPTAMEASPAPAAASSVYVPVAMTAAPAPAYAVASAEMGYAR